MMMPNEEPEPIPKDFYSFETNAPFTTCIECKKNLLDGGIYLIEKAFRNHPEYGVQDTIFDYALCMDCADDLRNELSEESMAALMSFFKERIDFSKRMERLNMSAKENITTCMITGKHVDECEEYQIYAFCKGNNISNEMHPYMICGEVMDEIIPILSKKTTDDLNGFFNKHFSPDPSLMEPIGPKLIVV